MVILRDSEFTSENGVTRGSGTIDDPYVIENWNIDASQGPSVRVVVNRTESSQFVILTNGQGVLVANTTAYLVIRNISVHSGLLSTGPWKGGIFLANVVNARIEESMISRNSVGIDFVQVRHSFVEGNQLLENLDGILVEGRSRDNLVTKNAITGGLLGMEVFGFSNDNIFLRNRIERQQYDGIFMSEVSSNIVEDNLIRDTGRFGILVGPGSFNIVRDNLFMRNDAGVWLEQSSGTNVTGNLILSNRLGVMVLQSPPNLPPPARPINTVTGNRIVNNEVGITSCLSTLNNILEPNIFRNNDQDIAYC